MDKPLTRRTPHPFSCRAHRWCCAFINVQAFAIEIPTEKTVRPMSRGINTEETRQKRWGSTVGTVLDSRNLLSEGRHKAWRKESYPESSTACASVWRRWHCCNSVCWVLSSEVHAPSTI